MILELWTDGSGMATGGPGGWAYVLRAINDAGEVLKQTEASGPIEHCTNQRAEMTAMLMGLRALERPTHVTVVSDSEYALDGFRKGWVSRWQGNGWTNRDDEPVANRDLWEPLAEQVARHVVTWRHVKGHAKVLRCESCQWTGERPKRQRKFPPCPRCEGVLKVRDEFPLNARCDELAGAQRRALIDGAAVMATATAPPAVDRPQPKKENRLQSGPEQIAAGVEWVRFMEQRRGGPPPPTGVDVNVLTEALRAVGRGHYVFKRENGQKAEPSAVRADRMTWTVVDTLSQAVYGMPFDALLSKQWFPKSDPPREVRRLVDATLAPQEFAVA